MQSVLKAAGCAAAIALMPMAAGAVTFNVGFGAASASFEAPETGGPISGLVVTLGGVTYDRAAEGYAAPAYDPVFNDFSAPGPGVSFSYWASAEVASGCPAALCLIEFEDRADPEIPPVWATNTVPFSETLGSGHYEITPSGPAPVPLPAPLLLMMAGIGGLGALGLRRKG